jgi:MFS family permease
MHNKRTAITVFLIAFSLGLNVMGISPILGVLNQRYEYLSVSAVQLLQTIPYALLIVGSLIICRLTLLFSKKRIVIFGLVIIGVFGILPFFNSSYSVLLTARIIIGLGFGLVSPLNTAIISEFIEVEKRPAYMGLHVVGMGVGALTGNLLGGFIAAVNYKYFYLVYSIAFISIIVVVLSMLETPPVGKSQRAGIKMNKKVYLISLVSFAHTLFITTFNTNIGIYILEKIHGDTAVTGTVIAVNAVFALGTGLSFSFLSRILGKWTLTASVLFGAAGYGVLLLLPNMAGVFIGSALCGISLSCFMARGSFLISTYVKQEAVAKAGGIFAIFGGIGGLLSPVILQAGITSFLKYNITVSQFLLSFLGMAVLCIIIFFTKTGTGEEN